MTKIGRNDPCWCGSGKKYKQCHLAEDEAGASEHRRLKTAGDGLLPRVIERAQQHIDAIPAAFARYWNEKYTPDQMAELDDLEGRGAERFLTWFAFDYPLDDGRTLVEQLAAGTEDFPLSDEEAAILRGWTPVRLHPYLIGESTKGREIAVTSLLDQHSYMIEDQAASRRVEPGEVLIVHLLPVANHFYIGGAAAHLTADTAESLRGFLDLHLEAMQREQPEATFDDMLHTRSDLLNHYVMELPVEEPDPTIFEKILMQTRVALALTGASIGMGTSSERDEQ